MTEAEGDRLEGEVGTLLRACGANIARLQALAEATVADGAAHRVGVVLSLSERLRATTAAYDKLRALRRQQLEQAAASRRRRQPVALEGLRRRKALEEQGSGPRSGTASPVRRLKAALFPRGAGGDRSPRPREGTEATQQGPLGHATASPRSRLAGRALVPGADASTTAPLPSSSAPPASPSRPPAQQILGARSPRSSPQTTTHPPHHHQQNQLLVDPVAAALERELEELSGSVRHTETQVREVAALNQAFSAAISHQTEQIERLYAEAVRATGHLERANVQLDKTARANRGGHWTLVAFMLLATLGLVLMDWWHS